MLRLDPDERHMIPVIVNRDFCARRIAQHVFFGSNKIKRNETSNSVCCYATERAALLG
jgi:hypothetical protein